jgi:hypothetical protein
MRHLYTSADDSARNWSPFPEIPAHSNSVIAPQSETILDHNPTVCVW